jgi:hypothetical protein
VVKGTYRIAYEGADAAQGGILSPAYVTGCQCSDFLIRGNALNTQASSEARKPFPRVRVDSSERTCLDALLHVASARDFQTSLPRHRQI